MTVEGGKKRGRSWGKKRGHSRFPSTPVGISHSAPATAITTRTARNPAGRAGPPPRSRSLAARSGIPRPAGPGPRAPRSGPAGSDAWSEYEAQGREFDRCVYLPARVSYVDDELVVAVADLARARFVTCFHEHFDGRQPPRGRHRGRGVSVAQRWLRYREDLRLKARGGGKGVGSHS